MNKKELDFIKKTFEKNELQCKRNGYYLVKFLFLIQHPYVKYCQGHDEELIELVREKINTKEWQFPDTVEEEMKNVFFTKDRDRGLEFNILFPIFDVDNQYSFRLLFNASRYLSSMYRYYLSNPNEIDIYILQATGHHLEILNGLIHKLTAHWAVKMEFEQKLSKRGKPGAEEMKRKKLERVTLVKNILPNYPSYKTDKKQRIALFSEAMRETDCLSSKSIENYLKELEIDKEE